MSKDFRYKHEDMPTGTDKEFVSMVKQARRDGVMNSSWMDRLIEIAERGVARHSIISSLFDRSV